MKTFFNRCSLIVLALMLVMTLSCLTVGAEATEAHVLQCPACATVTTGDPYCPACGEALPLQAAEWYCEEKGEDGTVCGQRNNSAYCTKCGTARPQPTEPGEVVFRFDASAFVVNLKYMAAGMVGIFLVIGVIVLTILLLGKLTAPRKKNDEASEA